MKKQTKTHPLLAVLFNFAVVAFACALFSAPIEVFAIGGITLNVVSLRSESWGHVPMDGQVFYSGLNKEIWIDRVETKLRQIASHIDDGEDMSEFVENNTINYAYAGDDPVIVIDDASQLSPIERTDSAGAVTLSTFRTTPTLIKDIQLVELSYNKMDSVLRQHIAALQQKQAQFAAYRWSPTAHATATPVIEATGTDRGDGNKKLTSADIARLSQIADAAAWPQIGRTLVLDSKTLWALVDSDPKLIQQYGYLAAQQGEVTGQIVSYYGWRIRMYDAQPLYRKVGGVWTRQGFNASATNADFQGGIAYVAKNGIMSATGTYDMFSQVNEPTWQADIYSFQARFTANKTNNRLVAAIVCPTA